MQMNLMFKHVQILKSSRTQSQLWIFREITIPSACQNHNLSKISKKRCLNFIHLLRYMKMLHTFFLNKSSIKVLQEKILHFWKSLFLLYFWKQMFNPVLSQDIKIDGCLWGSVKKVLYLFTKEKDVQLCFCSFGFRRSFLNISIHWRKVCATISFCFIIILIFFIFW